MITVMMVRGAVGCRLSLFFNFYPGKEEHKYSGGGRISDGQVIQCISELPMRYFSLNEHGDFF